jgi:FG-GAP-like repeat
MCLINQKLKVILVIAAVIVLVPACKDDSRTVKSTMIGGESSFLWVDETEKYLPVTGEWTNRVEVADINGDHLLDLIFANGGDYSEPGVLELSRIFLNRGPDSMFQEVTNSIFGQDKFYARVIKVRDLNQDQIPDMLVGTTFQTQSQLLLGIGTGEFKNVTSTQLPNSVSSIGDLEFGDVDDDGDLDIVLADWGPGSNMENSGGRTRLWLNNGKGYFTDVTTTQMPDLPIQFSWDVEFIDFDNDYDLDIAVSCKRCGTSRAFVNDGKGFYKNVRLLPAYTNNYEFEAMDVNNDGFLDLVTVNDGEIVNQQAWSRKEHLFLSDSGKRFNDVTPTHWPDPENIGEDDNNIVFLDFDSDGDPDFLLSSLTGEDRLLINDGTGKFNMKQPVLSGEPTPHTLSMVLGDINNDKKMDIIMGQGEGREIIEERIFIGSEIKADEAAPIISHDRLEEKGSGTFTVTARIHDNKSPNMPQDWESVVLLINDQPVPLTWYGENLWKATVQNKTKNDRWEICATDYAGNKSCITIQPK